MEHRLLKTEQGAHPLDHCKATVLMPTIYEDISFYVCVHIHAHVCKCDFTLVFTSLKRSENRLG